MRPSILLTTATLSTGAVGAPIFDALFNVAMNTLNTLSSPFINAIPGPSTAVDVSQARDKWRADTGIVSNFLSIAKNLSPTDLEKEAAIALSAENDELIHKAVLDREFVTGPTPNPTVVGANDVLVTQGTFQFVVDGLKNFSESGARMTPAQVSASIKAINEDRCTAVLSSIDQYFKAAGEFLKNDTTVQAIRPTNC